MLKWRMRTQHSAFTSAFRIQHSALSKRSCNDLVGLLADFVEHQLPPAVHEDLQKHLARCPQCVAQLKTYESPLTLLKSIRDEDLPRELRCTLKSFFDKNCGN
jgi:Putative zinc-finger